MARPPKSRPLVRNKNAKSTKKIGRSLIHDEKTRLPGQRKRKSKAALMQESIEAEARAIKEAHPNAPKLPLVFIPWGGGAGGRPRLYDTPLELWDKAMGYFKWLVDNPMYEAKLVSYQGESKLEHVPKMRAATIFGLTCYLGIALTHWGDYKAKSTEYKEVCDLLDNMLREQKFVGASAELLNPAIIARDLGLVDKHQDQGASDLAATLRDIAGKLPV